jgi:hypothetical protein
VAWLCAVPAMECSGATKCMSVFRPLYYTTGVDVIHCNCISCI